MSILNSQTDPPTLQNLGFMERDLDVRKIKVWDLKMLFRVFGGSLGLLFGAPGSVLGALVVLLGAPGGTPTSPNFSLGHP